MTSLTRLYGFFFMVNSLVLSFSEGALRGRTLYVNELDDPIINLDGHNNAIAGKSDDFVNGIIDKIDSSHYNDENLNVGDDWLNPDAGYEELPKEGRIEGWDLKPRDGEDSEDVNFEILLDELKAADQNDGDLGGREGGSVGVEFLDVLGKGHDFTAHGSPILDGDYDILLH
eukprot:CAMPEP_0184864266 /NCGR_PEP_ID=MMETSP0580-20130426/14325_1 /TAXON_ID=1118495 /ORGANISM="Dactyliosolen fragilissimus" /LENGTH=171 /DNA_ID=CAMNT_0027362975 /DNA_START=143 /DNA_END=658 /DNA_ORIENTATION=-